jgi:hypothetical protein
MDWHKSGYSALDVLLVTARIHSWLSFTFRWKKHSTSSLRGLSNGIEVETLRSTGVKNLNLSTVYLILTTTSIAIPTGA